MASNNKNDAKADAVFSKDVLIGNAAAFNTSPELMAGALASVKTDTITKKDAEAALKAFLARPVERGK